MKAKAKVNPVSVSVPTQRLQGTFVQSHHADKNTTHCIMVATTTAVDWDGQNAPDHETRDAARVARVNAFARYAAMLAAGETVMGSAARFAYEQCVACGSDWALFAALQADFKLGNNRDYCARYPGNTQKAMRDAANTAFMRFWQSARDYVKSKHCHDATLPAWTKPEQPRSESAKNTGKRAARAAQSAVKKVEAEKLATQAKEAAATAPLTGSAIVAFTASLSLHPAVKQRIEALTRMSAKEHAAFCKWFDAEFPTMRNIAKVVG